MSSELARVFLLLLLVGGAGRVQAQIFSAADAFFETKSYRQTLSQLEQIKSGNESNVEWLWRMARAEHQVAQQLGPKDPLKGQYMREAFAYAQKAVASNDRSANAHSWYAATVGSVGILDGNDAMIKSSYEVQKHALKAIALDPKDATNYHILGRWHFELADLSWAERTLARLIYSAPPKASFEEAAMYFTKAKQLDPVTVRNYLWLTKTDLKLDKPGEAKAVAEAGVKVAPRDPDEKRDLEELKALQKKL